MFSVLLDSTLEKESKIALWCNGSTEDFGSFSQGSNPCKATKNSSLTYCKCRCYCGETGKRSGL